MRFIRSLTGIALLLLASMVNAKTIIIGHVDLPYHQVTAAVYKTVLERSGYNVALKEGPGSILLSMLAEGEIDLFVAAWLPNMDGEDWEANKDKLVRIAPLYDNAKLFWAVPKYIPESEVSSIADLAKPDVISRMNKVIIGPSVERALAKRSSDTMKTYALVEAGYKLKTASLEDWVSNMNSNVETRSWFVMPLWQPQYLNKTAGLRALKDPGNTLGKPDTAWLLANRRTEDKIEAHIFDIVKRMEFSVEWIAELDRMVQVEQYSPMGAARLWMAAHPYTVEYWIDAE